MTNPDWWPGEQHAALTDWALSHGVVANGVTPARFPGRGLGMIATREIRKGEVLLEVPTSVMLTVSDIPRYFKQKFPEDTAVQALLSAFLIHGPPELLSRFDLWKKAWPSRQVFEESMPILWPGALGGPQWPDSEEDTETTDFLPPAISGHWNTIPEKQNQKQYKTEHQNLLSQQEARLRKAWRDVLCVFPETDWKTFSYHWLIINTRSFYWVGVGEEPPEDRNDAMALLPFADYFNHSDTACHVSFSKEGYVFLASEAYKAGEEVFISYGSHPNDFLLAEYGFFLDENSSDAIYLDDIVFQDIKNHEKREQLWMNQYYGNYHVTRQGVCYRTEVAACLTYMNEEDWQNHVLEGSSQGLDEATSEDTIKIWIRAYRNEADTSMAALRTVIDGSPELREHRQKLEMLLRRWVQIWDLCDRALKAVAI
ncbi:hypothetical protein N7510_000888 [Penicillium lagena]|uniref:uncharacterized protein n=1 Tax=Penicillium lagena TaxID=94218 RepID=UPI0025407865|nr:uncharacterized protein N7510_000888 [Penicillium lagena]KAJ5624579.1 hypothetical protein N7510_000888 [Penicillium lagena]